MGDNFREREMFFMAYPTTNQMAPPQQRLFELEQQRQQQIPNLWPQTAPLGLKGRPVNGVVDVVNSLIDADGTTYYYPDVVNDRIYTKQMNQDGSSTVKAYVLDPNFMNSISGYVTTNDFSAFATNVNSELQQIKQFIEQTSKQLQALKPEQSQTQNLADIKW